MNYLGTHWNLGSYNVLYVLVPANRHASIPSSRYDVLALNKKRTWNQNQPRSRHELSPPRALSVCLPRAYCIIRTIPKRYDEPVHTSQNYGEYQRKKWGAANVHLMYQCSSLVFFIYSFFNLAGDTTTTTTYYEQRLCLFIINEGRCLPRSCYLSPRVNSPILKLKLPDVHPKFEA